MTGIMDMPPGIERMKRGSRAHRWLQLAALAVTASLSIGWGSTWKEIRTDAGGVTSVRAEFTQEKTMKILARPLISTGIFYFRAPSSLRWEYRTPVRSILLIDDGRTARYVETGDGLVRDAGTNLQAMQAVLEQITGWLGGRFDDNPLFSSTLVPGRKIILVPKEAAFSRMIQKIELTLSDRAGVLESVTIYESSDSMTRIVLKNAVINAPLEDALFREIG
jgi:outer membrane lipoprotein-sorting protein